MSEATSQRRESARRDIEDIRALRACPAFTTYFLRRMQRKYELIDTKFRKDGPDKCDAVQREAYRQVLAMMEELRDMPATDEKLALNELERND